MRYLPGFHNVFDDFFDTQFFTPTATVNSMLCDIKDNGSEYEMNMALPGYKKENIQLKLEKGYLTVTATANTETEDKDDQGKVIRRERFTGTAERKFYVGDQMREDDIHAKFENGELIITIPKEIPERIEDKKFITIL